MVYSDNEELNKILQECDTLAGNISLLKHKNENAFSKLCKDVEKAYLDNVYPVLSTLSEVLLSIAKISGVYWGENKDGSLMLTTGVNYADIGWHIQTIDGRESPYVLRINTQDGRRFLGINLSYGASGTSITVAGNLYSNEREDIEYLGKLYDMLVVHHGEAAVTALHTHVALLLKQWKPRLLKRQGMFEGIFNKLEKVLASVPDSTDVKDDGTVDIVLNGKHYIGSVKEV